MATLDGNNAVTDTTVTTAGSSLGHSAVLLGDYTTAIGQVPRDDEAPQIYNFGVPSGEMIAPTDPVSFDVEDVDPGIALITISVKYGGDDATYVVYDGVDFVSPFDVNSTISGDANYYNIAVAHNEEWPASIEAMVIVAIDADGNSATETIDYHIPSVGGSAPVITVVSPNPNVAAGLPGGFPGDPTAAATTPIIIDVTDEDPGNRLIVVVARYFGIGAEEVVYRRGQFRGNYIAGSSQESITDGVRLTCRREGGWPSAPTFEVDAVDGEGNLAS